MVSKKLKKALRPKRPEPRKSETPRFSVRDTIYWSHDHSTTALAKEAYESAGVCDRCVYFICSLKKYKLLFLSPDYLHGRIEVWCSASLRSEETKLLKKGISSNEIWKNLNEA